MLERAAALDLAAADDGERGVQRRRELRMAPAEAGVELRHGRALGQLKR